MSGNLQSPSDTSTFNLRSSGGPKFWAANSFAYHKEAGKKSNVEIARPWNTRNNPRDVLTPKEKVMAWPDSASSSDDNSRRQLIGSSDDNSRRPVIGSSDDENRKQLNGSISSGKQTNSEAPTEPMKNYIEDLKTTPYIARPGFFNNGWADRPNLPLRKDAAHCKRYGGKARLSHVPDGHAISRNLGTPRSYDNPERISHLEIAQLPQKCESPMRKCDSPPRFSRKHAARASAPINHRNMQRNPSEGSIMMNGDTVNHYANPSRLKLYKDGRHLTCPEQLSHISGPNLHRSTLSGSLPDILSSPTHLPPPSTSTSVRNLNFLRNVNKRANRADRLVTFLKILSVMHLLCGLTLLSLDMALALLKWTHLQNSHNRLLYLLRILYPVCLILIGCLTIASALQKRVSTYVVMVLCMTIITIYCFVPTHTPLVQSMQEAIQFSNSLKPGHIPSAEDIFGDVPESVENALLPPWLVLDESRRNTAFPSNDPLLNIDDLRPEEVNIYDDMIQRLMGHLGEEMKMIYTVQHLNVAYCAIAIVHILVLICTALAAVRAIYFDL